MPHDPELSLRTAGGKGRGVFADRPFRKGQRVLTFTGPVLERSEVEDFARAIQIGRDLFQGPSGEVDDYVNHSCAPNCGLRESRGELQLVAFVPLAVDDEVTFDYSTCMVSEPRLQACSCGASTCRGVVGPFDELPEEVQEYYLRLAAVPRFVLEASGVGPRGRRRR